FARVGLVLLGMILVGPTADAQQGNQCSVGPVDLGTLGGGSVATRVNDRGQVIGFSSSSEESFQGFSWTDTGGLVSLGTLGGPNTMPLDLGDRGQVVGYSSLATGTSHAFIWTERGGMVDLGTLGGPISFATAVNSHGQVVGNSLTAG